jgi:integrase
MRRPGHLRKELKFQLRRHWLVQIRKGKKRESTPSNKTDIRRGRVSTKTIRLRDKVTKDRKAELLRILPVRPHSPPSGPGGRSASRLATLICEFLGQPGLSLYTVQGLLGHTQPRTTQRYAHLAPKTPLDATELISEAIGKPEPSE